MLNLDLVGGHQIFEDRLSFAIAGPAAFLDVKKQGVLEPRVELADDVVGLGHGRSVPPSDHANYIIGEGVLPGSFLAAQYESDTRLLFWALHEVSEPPENVIGVLARAAGDYLAHVSQKQVA